MKFAWRKHPLFTGTIILTATGLASRVIGFLYKIFLTHTIGAVGLGIYQLVFPIFTVCLALCVGGLQTAISKYTVDYGDSRPFINGLCICIIASFLCTFFIYQSAPFLAVHIIREADCTPLLRIISFSLPFACVHACFNGYYYGKKKTAIPAVSQFLEQIVRVLSVYLFYQICIEQKTALTPALAMWGNLCGEIAAVLFCISTFSFQKMQISASVMKKLLRFSSPLSGSRVILHLFSSAESILIPGALLSYGLTHTDALSVFGTLTGMALPVISLPTVLTGSVSVLLLPVISEAAVHGDMQRIRHAIFLTVKSCTFLGFGCTLIYLLFGRLFGQLLFHSTLAGAFIVSLGFLCPFLFLTHTLSSILHGLNLTRYTFLLNLLSCGLRLCTIVLLVPHFGLYVYLWSMLFSQLLQAVSYLILLLRKARSTVCQH